MPVLEAAGLLGDHSVVVAVSGGRRVDPEDPPADSHRLRWGALDSLRRFHDRGVLHGDVGPCSLFVQLSPQVAAMPALLRCTRQAC